MVIYQKHSRMFNSCYCCKCIKVQKPLWLKIFAVPWRWPSPVHLDRSHYNSEIVRLANIQQRLFLLFFKLHWIHWTGGFLEAAINSGIGIPSLQENGKWMPTQMMQKWPVWLLVVTLSPFETKRWMVSGGDRSLNILEDFPFGEGICQRPWDSSLYQITSIWFDW